MAARPEVTFTVTLTGGTWIDGRKEFAIRYDWTDETGPRTYRTTGHDKGGACKSGRAHGVTDAAMLAALAAAGIK